MSTLNDAIQLARIVEPIAVKHGAHVALTGGCLYGEGERKDIDLFFYSHRGGPGIQRDALLAELVQAGIVLGAKRGTVRKAQILMSNGWHYVDLFFRELPPEWGSEQERIEYGEDDSSEVQLPLSF